MTEDNRVCAVCDGGPGNDCACTCGLHAYEADAVTTPKGAIVESAPAPIVEGTEEGRWKHPLETLERPVAGWTLTSLQRLWGVGVAPFWAVSLMHETSGAEVTANNSTIDLALSDACAEANRAEIVEPTNA